MRRLARHLPPHVKGRRFYKPVLVVVEYWYTGPGSIRGSVFFSGRLAGRSPRLHRWTQLLSARRVLDKLNEELLMGGRVR